MGEHEVTQHHVIIIIIIIILNINFAVRNGHEITTITSMTVDLSVQ